MFIETLPPMPEQLKVYVVSLLIVPTFLLPLGTATGPTPWSMEQLLTYLQSHDKVTLFKGGMTILLGEAVKELHDGGGCGQSAGKKGSATMMASGRKPCLSGAIPSV